MSETRVNERVNALRERGVNERRRYPSPSVGAAAAAAAAAIAARLCDWLMSLPLSGDGGTSDEWNRTAALEEPPGNDLLWPQLCTSLW